MKEKILHTILWVFVFLYLFDYMIEGFETQDAILMTLFELAVIIAEFYLNLFVLIPKLFVKGKRILYVLALFALMTTGFYSYSLFGMQEYLLGETLPRAVLSYSLNHSFFIFVSIMVWYYNMYFHERHRTIALEKEKLLLELNLLKSQISPHFLFNTLNNIYAMATIKHENTPEMISATSDLLRYYSMNSQKRWVPLNTEVEIIQRYLSIQKMRDLIGKHELKINIDQQNGLVTPPLVLLTLVENAFKHSDVSTNPDGFIRIAISSSDEIVQVNIENSVDPKRKSNGIGLKNIENQLSILFGEQCKYAIESGNDVYRVNLKFNGTPKI